MDANIYFLVSFCIFCFIFKKKFWPSIIQLLDQHIEEVKHELLQKKEAISKHKKLKALYQEKLHNLDTEIKEIKTSTSQKFNFLKIKLDKELEIQYGYRQKCFHQIIHRTHRQQSKIIQTKCVEEILQKVKQELKKKQSFTDEYMVSVLSTNKKIQD